MSIVLFPSCLRLEITKLSNGAKPGMSYLIRMLIESRGGYNGDTVLERRNIFVRREDRACCIFY